MIVRGTVKPKRACDLCGALREGGRLISGRWVCPSHDHFIPEEALDRLPTRTFKTVPIKNSRPFVPTPTFERGEMEVFDLVSTYYRSASLDLSSKDLSGFFDDQDGFLHAPSPTTFSVSKVPGAAWAAIYLYELIAENKRPVILITRAKAKLREIADYLLTQMAGGPTVSGSIDGRFSWGAFPASPGSTTYNTADSAAGGLALLRAYQVHGTSTYLAAARACAYFCRGAQCYDKAAGAVVGTHYGAWISSYPLAPVLGFYPRDLLALEFLQRYLEVVGDETIGTTDTAHDFAATCAAKVSVAISEARAFWLNGAFDTVLGSTIVGLSTATPYDHAEVSAGPAFSWKYANGDASTGTTINAQGWALAIRGLRAVDGNSATVTGLFDWLMSFASNSSFELPAKYSDKTLWSGINGTYDPRLALCGSLQVKASASDRTDVRKNAASSYDLTTVGLLAPLYSLRQASRFGELKSALEEPRPCSRGGLEDGKYLFLGPLGGCGLSFQPYTYYDGFTISRVWSIQYAAMTGLIYREKPQAFTGRGH